MRAIPLNAAGAPRAGATLGLTALAQAGAGTLKRGVRGVRGGIHQEAPADPP